MVIGMVIAFMDSLYGNSLQCFFFFFLIREFELNAGLRLLKARAS